jgi:hypothetical protein
MNQSKLKQYLKYHSFAIVLLIQSCSFNTKDNYLDDFTNFITEIEANYKEYSSEDWQFIDAKIEEFTETRFDIHKENLTNEDKKEIGKLIARYTKVRSYAYGKQFKEGLEDATNYFEGFIDGLIE